ncbi:putative RNA-directed DNA polymerase [Tanacetum coccineum]|uniref:RNA-directed DNA polymerase n=1 Tax=Tanacetum coccineum TaxID=301880 RepID=A0ABQ5AS92_9ASTR
MIIRDGKQESSSKSRQARVEKKETGGKQETVIDEKAENTVKECTNWKDKKKDKEQEALLISEDTAFGITGENIGPKPNPVKSRAWRGRRGRSMIPFADFFNHDIDSETRPLNDDFEQFIAGKDYAPGDEVFLKYVDISNDELLLHFGFMIPFSQYDTVLVEITVPQHDHLRAMKLDLLDRHTPLVLNGFKESHSCRCYFLLMNVESSCVEGLGIPISLRAFARVDTRPTPYGLRILDRATVCRNFCTELQELAMEATEDDGYLAHIPLKNKAREMEAHRFLRMRFDDMIENHSAALEELAMEATEDDGYLAHIPLKNKAREMEAHRFLRMRFDDMIENHSAALESLTCAASPTLSGKCARRMQLARDLLTSDLQILRSASAWLKCYCETLKVHTGLGKCRQTKVLLSQLCLYRCDPLFLPVKLVSDLGKIEDLLYVKDYYLPVFTTEKPENKTDAEWTILHRQGIINQLAGKQTRLAFKSRSPFRMENILDLVHSDVCGPMKTKTLGGCSYFVTFIDDHSRKRKTKCIRTDNRGEYIGPFDAYCREHGIQHQKTPPKIPQLNGLAERMNRTLVERVRCLLSHAGLPASFWGEALNMAVHVINLTPCVPLRFDVPDRVWSDKDVSYRHLRVFGCKAFVHIPKDERSKLDVKTKPCVFLGYGQDEFGYRLYDPVQKRLVRSRDVVFEEDQTLKDVENAERETIPQHKDDLIDLDPVPPKHFDSQFGDDIQNENEQVCMMMLMLRRATKLDEDFILSEASTEEWYKNFESVIGKQGYRKTSSDHCVFFQKFGDDDFIILLLYVMKYLGPAKQIIGIRIFRDRGVPMNYAYITKQYIENVMQVFNMDKAKVADLAHALVLSVGFFVQILVRSIEKLLNGYLDICEGEQFHGNSNCKSVWHDLQQKLERS